MIELPLHISHSQLSSWSGRCQKEFELERLRKAPRLPSWWLLGGSAVHEVSEDLDREQVASKLTMHEFNETIEPEVDRLFQEKLDELIRKEQLKSETPKEDWLAAGFRPKQDEAFWRTNGPQMVRNWLTWRERTGWEIAYLDGEPAIELKLEDELDLPSPGPSFFGGMFTMHGSSEDSSSKSMPVLGAPDRVMVLPNGELVIVDVKSGSSTPKTLLQQGLYATLLEKEFSVRPKYGTFVKVGVKAGGVHTALTPLAKYDERYFEQLFGAYRAQLETRTFLPNVTDMCDRCGVAAACYAAGGAESAKWDPLNPEYEGQK